MENTLVNKQEIAAMKAKRLSFNRRKACIRKKTMELSVLCDVNACVFIVDGSEVETWPEKQHDVLKIINEYKKCRDDVDNNKEDVVVDHQNQSWEDYLIDELPTESLEGVLRTVDSKLEALVSRIEAVKMAAVNKHPNNDANKDKEKMIITQAPTSDGNGTFKDEESDFCFGNVVLGSSSGTGAAAEREQGFLSMQAFLQTPYVQESSDQKPQNSTISDQRFFNYVQPAQINPLNIQGSDQILYYLPHGQYLQPPHPQFTAN